jgi:50S ribosomal subunit-associated GTPase HflX
MLLVGNKVDLQGKLKADVTEDFAENHQLMLIRTSATTGQNIEELFATIAELIESDVEASADLPMPLEIATTTRTNPRSACC